MAIGSEPVSLEITQQPTKQTYEAGRPLDTALACQVMATYKNGAKRDITTALDWNTDALTVNDTQFQLTLPLGFQPGRQGGPGGPRPDSDAAADRHAQADPPPPTPPALPFTDVPENAWYTENVRNLYRAAFDVPGARRIRFQPEPNLTRAMFVAMLYRMEGSPEVAGRRRIRMSPPVRTMKRRSSRPGQRRGLRQQWQV